MGSKTTYALDYIGIFIGLYILFWVFGLAFGWDLGFNTDSTHNLILASFLITLTTAITLIATRGFSNPCPGGAKKPGYYKHRYGR